MTDRELLELAAVAAGIEIFWKWSGVERTSVPFTRHPNWYARGMLIDQPWTPLTDDGDALRLAVKLGIRLEFADGWVVANAGGVCAPQFSERTGSDAGAATRRAIVRAAAEIGKAMP